MLWSRTKYEISIKNNVKMDMDSSIYGDDDVEYL